MTWLLHLLDRYGITNANCRWGVFWAGAGSDLTELSIPVTAVVFWYHHTCHVSHLRFCWRWGAHPVEGTPFKACRKHHPTVPDRVSAEHIHDAHRDVLAGSPSTSSEGDA